MIKAKVFTDCSLRTLDFVVNPIRRETNETCREISEKRFKLQLIA
jgi:hypothetical protein